MVANVVEIDVQDKENYKREIDIDRNSASKSSTIVMVLI
jgi:hypothetical protein